MRMRRLIFSALLAPAVACDCGSLQSAHDAFCEQRPDVCDAGGADAGTEDAGAMDSGARDAGSDAGPTCAPPQVTQPTPGESVGEAINLHADGGSCLVKLTAYLDISNPTPSSPPAMLANDGGPATVQSNVYPVPYWMPVSCGPHTVVVLGFDSNARFYASAPMSFTRTYNANPSDVPCDGG